MNMSVQSVGSDDTEEITPYQVINLLLDGALERVDQAISRIAEGEVEQAAELIQKTIAIVSGLRDSLDMEVGGAIAINLDKLYEYIVLRLNSIDQDNQPIAILDEVRKLLNEVHQAWLGIESEVLN